LRFLVTFNSSHGVALHWYLYDAKFEGEGLRVLTCAQGRFSSIGRDDRNSVIILLFIQICKKVTLGLFNITHVIFLLLSYLNATIQSLRILHAPPPEGAPFDSLRFHALAMAVGSRPRAAFLTASSLRFASEDLSDASMFGDPLRASSSIIVAKDRVLFLEGDQVLRNIEWLLSLSSLI
jgi:hypothetical protein